MNTEMNGKPIKGVYWPDTNTEEGRCLKSSEGIELELSATHHGMFDEFWIIQYGLEGREMVEVARHNPRLVETIVWA